MSFSRPPPPDHTSWNGIVIYCETTASLCGLISSAALQNSGTCPFHTRLRNQLCGTLSLYEQFNGIQESWKGHVPEAAGMLSV